MFGYRSNIGQIFSATSFDLSLKYSYVTILANLINILFMMLSLAYIVEKANKCLDFTATVFLFHILFSWIVFKFPSSSNWWVTHGIIITITVLSSEFLCMKLETAEIKLSVNHIIEKGKEIGIKGA
jgi:hypothetical protein